MVENMTRQITVVKTDQAPDFFDVGYFTDSENYRTAAIGIQRGIEKLSAEAGCDLDLPVLAFFNDCRIYCERKNDGIESGVVPGNNYRSTMEFILERVRDKENPVIFQFSKDGNLRTALNHMKYQGYEVNIIDNRE